MRFLNGATKYLKEVEIFWDNGKYVAIVEDNRGSRYNVAPYNCQTKREARDAAREFLQTGTDGPLAPRP